MINTATKKHFHEYIRTVLDADMRRGHSESNEDISAMLRIWSKAFDELQFKEPELSRSDLTALVVINMASVIGMLIRQNETTQNK